MKGIKASWEVLPGMNQKPFKIIFWINETKIYTKSEGLAAVNYIALHAWTLGLGGIKHRGKVGIFTGQ